MYHSPRVICVDSNNVHVAIRRIQPFGVDSCSLLEKEKGKKDKFKTIDYIEAVRYIFNRKITSIYDLLFLIQHKTSMYIGRCSISNLAMFLWGIKFAETEFAAGNSNFDWKQFDPNGEPRCEFGFQAWISRKFLNNKGSRQTWSDIILLQVADDEEKALELFFALLEEFKLEKENLDEI